MKFAGKFLSFAATFILLFSTVILAAIPASAASSYSVDLDNAAVSVTVPSKFTGFTVDDMDESADYFKNMPVTKNEAIKRIENGICINAFSNDKKREIRFSVYDSENLGEYVSGNTLTTNIVSSTASDLSLLDGINNYSALTDAERSRVITVISDELKSEGHTFLSTPTDIELSGYHFIKTYARIGNSQTGYTYTSVMTIIGAKCYELTCFDNSPVLEQSQIDANGEVISSLKLKVKGDSGELAANNFQSVVAYIVIIAAAGVIIGIIVSFIKPLIAARYADEPIKPKKRK